MSSPLCLVFYGLKPYKCKSKPRASLYTSYLYSFTELHQYIGHEFSVPKISLYGISS